MDIITNPFWKHQPVLTFGPFIVSDEGASHSWKYAIEIKNKRLVVFEKFETLAIGFEGGEWDLPIIDCTVEEIWWMIKSDRGRQVKKDECLEAIRLLKAQVELDELNQDQSSREFKRASEAWLDYNNR